jgi:hypothetical protein
MYFRTTKNQQINNKVEQVLATFDKPYLFEFFKFSWTMNCNNASKTIKHLISPEKYGLHKRCSALHTILSKESC